MKARAKVAYSYIRFSNAKQARGDSLRRQLQWGRDLCAQRSWTLDERLKLQDLGVSAFRGQNAATGHLAAFRDAIKTGHVKPGAVLLVESLDRLSRQDIDEGWELFRSILKAGVEIYTREPERHYAASELTNFGTRVEVQAYFLRAWNESHTKSMRGKEVWKARRAALEANNGNGQPKPIHQVCPAWLRLSKDRQRFEVIPDAAKAVKLIYKWAGEGLGLNPITRRLNDAAAGVAPIGRSEVWTRSYVAKLLQDKSVIGEYQPHSMKDGKRMQHGEPISKYFPAVIEEKEWYRVRNAVSQRGKQLGPKGVGIANLFTSLIRDARDGQTMHLVYSGSSRENNTRVLVSYGVRHGLKGSVRMHFPYDAIEAAFLTTVRDLKAADIADDRPVHDHEEEIASLQGKLDELERKLGVLQDRLVAEPGIDALMTALERLDKERKDTAAKLEARKAEAAHQQPTTALKDTQSLVQLLRKTKGKEAKIELRNRIKIRIRQLVSEMWMFVWDASKSVRCVEMQIHFHSGKVRQMLLGWYRRGRQRGQIIGHGAELNPAGETASFPLPLRDYRKSAKVRAAYEDKMKKRGRLVAASEVEAEKKRKAERNAARKLRKLLRSTKDKKEREALLAKIKAELDHRNAKRTKAR